MSKKLPMIMGIVSAAATVLAAVVALLAYLDSKPSTNKTIAGTWIGIDSGDQSRMTLRIASTGGATYQTILDDPLASTFCKTTAATVTGAGTLSGNRLVSTGSLVCADGRRLDSTVTVVFTYHPENDTITDDGTGSPVWARSS